MFSLDISSNYKQGVENPKKLSNKKKKPTITRMRERNQPKPRRFLWV